MGRLPALTGACTLAVALASGCDKTEAPGASSRSEQVTVAADASLSLASPPAASAAATSAHAPPAPPRRLCDGDGNAKGRSLSKALASHAEAPGAARLDGTIAPKGQWTWINFWAAWCGPCKEEMPRLLAWQDKLSKTGTPVRFAFVSLDDDERQLDQFLAAQPEGGLKGSLWLPDGPARSGWLAALKMKSAPELPEQALVDPTGRVRCFVEGAVDDGDYAEIAALVAR
jgi:thiol-disulfide isomerase/thioredoxin